MHNNNNNDNNNNNNNNNNTNNNNNNKNLDAPDESNVQPSLVFFLDSVLICFCKEFVVIF